MREASAPGEVSREARRLEKGQSLAWFPGPGPQRHFLLQSSYTTVSLEVWQTVGWREEGEDGGRKERKEQWRDKRHLRSTHEATELFPNAVHQAGPFWTPPWTLELDYWSPPPHSLWQETSVLH